MEIDIEKLTIDILTGPGGAVGRANALIAVSLAVELQKKIDHIEAIIEDVDNETANEIWHYLHPKDIYAN